VREASAIRPIWLILGALGAALAAAAASVASAPFTPASFAGTWNGTWKNERFLSTGPAKIVATSLAGGTKLRFTADFGGNVFGCADPPPESTPALTKGTGANHWSATGFQIKGASKDFGTLTIAYNAKTGALTGSGTNPTCAVGLSWTVTGKFAGKMFTGKVSITLADKSTAVSDLSLTKS
jgi:hypothetical protein